MNLLSFLDELVKVGSFEKIIRKHAAGGDGDQGNVNTVDVPEGMMDTGASPPAININPAEANTRIPLTASRKPLVESGHLGGVSQAKDPIDQLKYNRAYRDRR